MTLDMGRCIFHVDLDAFFVSVEQALDPGLRGRPVIVGGRPDRRGVVASASYEARAFGIRAGTPLSRAYQPCPQAIFIEGNISRYTEASENFMTILSGYSPYLEPAGLDEAYLDVTGCGAYGTPQQLARHMKEQIKARLQLTASIGIASCKVVAKIASDIGKPDGLVEVMPGTEKDFLAPLPISSLPGVGKKTEATLKALGVNTIGQLASLPLPTVKSHLGASGVALHNYARGIDTRRVEPPGEAKSISRETTFARDTLELPFLKGVLRYLCEQVGTELRSQNKQARRVTIKLRYADFETITRSLTSGEATSSDDMIFSRAEGLLHKALSQRRELVRLVGVEVSGLTGYGKQLRLFEPAPWRFEHLDRAIDRIRRKYGFASIQTGRTLLLKDIFTASPQTATSWL